MSSPLKTPRVVVIGAGVGGLTAALLLACRGLDVTLVERADTPGGKLRQVAVGGSAIDCGPTVFTMRDVFDGIFADADATLEDHLVLEPISTLARHAWTGDARLDLHADIDHSVDAIARFAGPVAGRAYRTFCVQARHVYRTLDRPFMKAPAPSMLGLIRAVGLSRDLLGLAPFSSLWNALGSHFSDPRLRQLFARYATYCGSSPFACPATLMLVAHVEQAGVWLIEGGMHRLAIALADLARQRGARLRFGTGATAIRVEHGRVASVDLDTDERLLADAVVCNADVAALASGILGDDVRRAAPATNPAARSLSAVTFAFKASSRNFPLLRHNVFFSDDYKAEFDDLFRLRRLAAKPTVYVCAQDRDETGACESGAERLFCIVNAPANGDTHSFDASEIAQCEATTFQTLQRCGLTLEQRSNPLRTTTPNDFDRLFPATGGALYGAASHGALASFRRSGVRSRIPGLYLCGGSVHPGPGLPMAALSGRMASTSLIEDWALTRRSRPMVTLGGISTA